MKIAEGLFNVNAKAAACATASGKIVPVAIIKMLQPGGEQPHTILRWHCRERSVIAMPRSRFQMIYAKVANVPFAKFYISECEGIRQRSNHPSNRFEKLGF